VKAVRFHIRGLGTDSCSCMICNEKGLMSNFAAFIESKEEGELAVEMFGNFGAWLDFRPREPKWVQVKVGACKRHLVALYLLMAYVDRQNAILTQDLIDAVRKAVPRETS
jgi:hypothetical protein